MQVFLTGATGYIGSAVLDALIKGGHEVTTLVRNGERAAELRVRGVTPVIGALGDPGGWREEAAGKDAIVHTAFDGGAKGPEQDLAALNAFLELAPPVLVYTSGVWVLGSTTVPADESASTARPAALSAWRVPHERQVLTSATPRARTIVVRPGIVYGGSRGIVGDMLRDATNGLVRVIGSGTNHWPLIYDRDLGDLYNRLVMAPDAAGIYHATGDRAERVNDIVEAIRATIPSRLEVRHMPIEEARTKLGPFADALALDQVVESPRARALGWSPALHSVAGNVPRLLEEWRRGRETAEGRPA
jgi:nucleoside-diphosphate-sugar epimerase